jgi:predicted nucleic acid-binding Zn ribbon protein
MSIKNRECRECGKEFVARQRTAQFCSDPCRAAFNRRRRDRGAELYDFVMSPGKATEPIVRNLIDAYRAADAALRGGRPSYQPPEAAQMALPAAFGAHGDGR